MTQTSEQVQALKAAAESVIQAYGDEWFGTGSQICTLLKSKVNFIAATNPVFILSLLAEREADKALIAEQAGRIAELEREQQHLRPVGVMSEKAFHRLESSECRFIALFPRPGIYLPRKRPEDGVIVYARTSAAAGITLKVGGE